MPTNGDKLQKWPRSRDCCDRNVILVHTVVQLHHRHQQYFIEARIRTALTRGHYPTWQRDTVTDLNRTASSQKRRDMTRMLFLT